MNKSITYLKTSLGNYALTRPMYRPSLPPKNLLVRLSPRAEVQHAAELKPAETKCVETKTKAKFCIFKFDNVELEGMEQCRPVFEFRRIIETKEPPTIEECRTAGKNDFLVVSCKPKEFCEKA